MLPKNLRLTRKRIEFLYKKGKRQNTSYFAITFIPNNLTFSRFSVVVSTKVHAHATDRNKLRRQCYEILRTHFTELPTGMDTLIYTRNQTVKLSFSELTDKLLEAIKKICP